MFCFTLFSFAETDKENGQDSQDNVNQQDINSTYSPSIQDESKNGGIESRVEESREEIKDDTTHNSFSKFNYIFYFIYKYKYENRSAGLDNLKDFTLMD